MSDRKQRDQIRSTPINGIEFYDNPLPTWWVGLFHVTAIFGLAYFVWFHVLSKPGLKQELDQDRKIYQQLAAANQQPSAVDPEELKARLRDPKAVEEGRLTFAANCAPCHGPNGEGTVGPNLTDKFWIHGGAPDQILAVITNGVPAMGMMAWGPILGTQQVERVTAFVLSLQGTRPASSKAPQGDEYKD